MTKTKKKLSKKESRISILVSVLFVFSILVSAGGYLFVKHVSQREAAEQARDLIESDKIVEPEVPDISQDFENLLNEFLASIAGQSKAYKTQRKILFELSKPANLREKDYIEENYALAKGMLPTLHTKMNRLIKTFEMTENNTRLLLEGQSDETRAAVWSEWQDLKVKQITPYIAFFSVESQILEVYEELMDFYYVKQNKYIVDLDTGRMDFKLEADGEAHQVLKDRMSALSREQARALAR